MLGPGGFHIGLAGDFGDGFVELVDHGLGCAGGRHQAQPDGGFVTGHAGFGQGRHFGHHVRALEAGGGQCLDFAGAHLLGHGGDGVKHQVNLAADHVSAGARAAFVGHVNGIDVGHALEQFAGHVIRRAGAGRCVVQLAGVGLGEGEQVFEVVGCHLGVGDQHQVGVINGRHGHKVAHQHKRLDRDQRLVDGVRVGHQQQRVAVSR